MSVAVAKQLTPFCVKETLARNAAGDGYMFDILEFTDDGHVRVPFTSSHSLSPCTVCYGYDCVGFP